jgi:hypothetical protein
MKCKTTCNDLEILENKILEFLRLNPKSSITEICNAVNGNYLKIYRILNGKSGSLSFVGLCAAGVVEASPGISIETGRLVWLYRLVI